MGHESLCEGDTSDIVDGDLVLYSGNIDGVRLGDIHDVLNAGFEDNKIQVRMGLDQSVGSTLQWMSCIKERTFAYC